MQITVAPNPVAYAYKGTAAFGKYYIFVLDFAEAKFLQISPLLRPPLRASALQTTS